MSTRTDAPTRREQILREAARLFAERGFHGVGVDEIGAAVGISGPGLYRHFAGKEAMLAELLVGISERLLSGGELVGVWPEGFKGIGKNFRDRYKLQRFGRGGFVSAALRTGTPIVPCSIVGAEETYPKIGDIPPLARLFGAPYFPITPTFPLLGPAGLVPLPSKWYIEFGEPIRTDDHTAADAEDPMLVFNLTDQVRETIQHTLYRLLSQRRNVFLG